MRLKQQEQVEELYCIAAASLCFITWTQSDRLKIRLKFKDRIIKINDVDLICIVHGEVIITNSAS